MAHRQKVIAVALGASIVVSVAGIQPAFAASTSQIQNQINGVHNRQSQKKDQISKNKKNLQQVQGKESQTIAAVKKLEGQISGTESQISQKQNDISKTKAHVNNLKKQISATEKRIQKRNELLKKRVRLMYKDGGSVSYLQVLLGSQNFSDFLDRVVALNLIAKQDKQLLDAQKADKKKLEKDKATVEKELSQLQGQLNSLKDLQSQLQQKKQEKSALMKQLQTKENSIKSDISSEKNAMQYIQSKIAGLIKKKEAVRKKEAAAAAAKAAAAKKRAAEAAQKKAQEQTQQQSQQQQSQSVQSTPQPVQTLNTSGSGKFITPIAPGHYVISSGYGWRTLRGGRDFHDGIDYAAPKGTPIYAVASGTVLFAGPASGFGNWIVIQLPSGLCTVYGHMYNNEIKVSVGESVSQGQQIAAVGDNGDSTGYHLHFEVDRDAYHLSGDQGINPNPYF